MLHPKKFRSRLRSILRLSFALAKYNIKLRNEGTYFGFFWYILEPLLLFLLLSFIFSSKLGSSIEYYNLYLLFGLIIFNFFRNSTSSAVRAISSNAQIVKSIRIPLAALVVSTVLQFLYSHFFELAAFSLFILYYKKLSFTALYYFIVLLFYFFFILGVSFMLAVLGLFIRDFINIWPVFLRLLWFATPLFYRIDNPHPVYLMNPLIYYLDASRSLVIYHTVPAVSTIIITAMAGMLSFFIGAAVFSKWKGRFAEYA